MAAQLARKDESGKPVVLLDALRLFVQHGVRYSFPATHGSMERGMPTAHAAAPLKMLIVQSTEPVPVWPHKDGTVRGVLPAVPHGARCGQKPPALYELLALVDAVRGGRMRERALAIAELDKRWAS